MSKIQQLINTMNPEDAAAEIGVQMKKLFPLLGEKSRLEFVKNVIGDARNDKVGGLVHL